MLQIYTAVTTTLLTMAAVAICRWAFGVKIHAVQKHNQYGKTTIIEISEVQGEESQLNAIYIRLSISKKGIGTLKGCLGHLVDVTFTADGKTPSRVFWDSIPLQWSFTKSEKLDIPSSVSMMLAVCSSREGSKRLRPAVTILPNHYRDAFTEKGRYEFKVSISAENAPVKTCCIEVVWNGKWDEIEAREMRCS